MRLEYRVRKKTMDDAGDSGYRDISTIIVWETIQLESQPLCSRTPVFHEAMIVFGLRALRSVPRT